MQDDPKILREIVEQTFSFEDLNPRRFNLNVMLNSNQFCPFHDNRNTPASKAFMDDDKGIVVLWCFTEQRRYTAYDYVNLIMVRKQKLYPSVKDFLIQKLGEQKFDELYSLVEQNVAIDNETMAEQKRIYIQNLYNEYDNVTDFIEHLYLELD